MLWNRIDFNSSSAINEWYIYYQTVKDLEANKEQ